MIGRSLVIFQRGDNQNELYEVNSWSLFSSRDDLAQKIIERSIEEKWKPCDTVSDSEVEIIVNAKSIIRGSSGYHKWASDGVTVINLSGDPNLYNPAKARAEKEKAEWERKRQAKEELKKFLPELVALRDAIPSGTLRVEVTVPLTVEIGYGHGMGITRGIYIKSVFDKGGTKVNFACLVVGEEDLRNLPELREVVNCPKRKAYLTRTNELAESLGLKWVDVENAAYTESERQKRQHNSGT